MEKGFVSELLTEIHKLKEKYNKDNKEVASMLQSIAEHFEWYERHKESE